MIRIEQLRESEEIIDALSLLLIEAVADYAGVSFLDPLSREKATAFWRSSLASAARGERVVLGAFDGSDLVGTVTLNLDMPENQPHRGDIAKMMVAMRARRRGIAADLLRAAETAARQKGRTLLVLDTETGGKAQKLYEKLGWAHVGDIPEYAMHSDGNYAGTSLYFRRLT